MMLLNDILTPSLILDLDRVERNCARMIKRADQLGVQLRPHMKTAKSADLARLAVSGRCGAITVSTLAEAEYFARNGFQDITYAVGIDPRKITQLAELQRRYGARINILLDSPVIATEVARRAKQIAEKFSVFIEIDCGGGRGGLSPIDPALLTTARAVSASPLLSLSGVLTHAGQSYGAKNTEEIAETAEDERRAVVQAAERLRAGGYPVTVVSVGSTPTVLLARTLTGVTEIRPGVYTLFDLDQVELGVCTVDDIAVSVLATVIGHNPRSERLLIDAGGLALSKDLSAGKHNERVGYGLICLSDGKGPINDLRVVDVHQEHGFVASSTPFEVLQKSYPIGTRFRILPNHACMMAAPYDRYVLVRGAGLNVVGTWKKNVGWFPQAAQDFSQEGAA